MQKGGGEKKKYGGLKHSSVLAFEAVDSSVKPAVCLCGLAAHLAGVCNGRSDHVGVLGKRGAQTSR